MTLRFNHQDHLVDSIVNFKKTFGGNSLFKLTMYCECCKNRTYWFSRKEIIQNGCGELDLLANQVEELYMKGVDICSQNTFYAEDFDEGIDLCDDAQATNLNSELQRNSNHFQNDACFDFSSDEDPQYND